MRSLWLFSLFFSLAIISCDKCKDVECMNNGACDEGTCLCPTGFSGTSCEIEDKCTTNDVECLNGGECQNGECDCPEWYEGDDCGIKTLEQNVGLYSGSYSCSSQWSYIFKLEHSAKDGEMLIIDQNSGANSYENDEFIAVFTSVSNFDVPLTSVDHWNNDALFVEGEGSIKNYELIFTVTYTNSTQGTSTTCNFISN
ncbi:MAG: hypothetical protein WEC59_12160 [Salibacteraceae bacterium]